MRSQGAETPDPPERFGIAAYRLLRAVAGEMLALRDPAGLLARCGDLVQELLHADACSIALLDQRADELVPLLTAASGRSVAMGPLPTEQLSGRMLRAIRDGRSLIVAHGMLIDGDVPIQLVETQSALAAMLIPLPVQGGMHGVLWVGRVHGLPFSPDEQELAETIAALVALGLRGTLPAAQGEIEGADPLTGLPERDGWLTGLGATLRANAPCALLLCAIDNFARVRAIHGREAGDALLRDLGQLLREELRADDIACRYTDEMIAVLLADGDRERARIVAARLRARFAAVAEGQSAALPSLPVGEERERPALSIGLAVAPDDATNAGTLLHLAELALALARARGGNGIAGAEEIAAEHPSAAD